MEAVRSRIDRDWQTAANTSNPSAKHIAANLKQGRIKNSEFDMLFSIIEFQKESSQQKTTPLRRPSRPDHPILFVST